MNNNTRVGQRTPLSLDELRRVLAGLTFVDRRGRKLSMHKIAVGQRNQFTVTVCKLATVPAFTGTVASAIQAGAAVGLVVDYYCEPGTHGHTPLQAHHANMPVQGNCAQNPPGSQFCEGESVGVILGRVNPDNVRPGAGTRPPRATSRAQRSTRSQRRATRKPAQ